MAVVAVGMAGCTEPPTRLVARIDSDLAPCTELRTVVVVAQRENGPEIGRRQLDLCAQSLRYPGEVAIAPKDLDDTRRVVLTVTGQVQPSLGAAYTLRQEFVTPFQRGRTIVVRYSLVRACAVDPCPSGFSCVPGPAGEARCASREAPSVLQYDERGRLDAASWDDALTVDVAVADANRMDAPDVGIPMDALDGSALDRDALDADDRPDLPPDVPDVGIDAAHDAEDDVAATDVPGPDGADATHTEDVDAGPVDVAADERGADVTNSNAANDGAVADVGSCGVGRSRCGEACVDVQVDAANCGTCGTVCPAPQVCAVGRCVPPCSTGETYCGSLCSNLTTSHDNCGACGRNCGRGTCRMGNCTPYLITTSPCGRLGTIAYDGIYIYTACHYSSGGLYRVRAEPPGSPERIGEASASTQGVYLLENNLYWSAYTDGIARWIPSAGGMTSSIASGLSSIGDIMVEDDFIYSIQYDGPSPASIFRVRRLGGTPERVGQIPVARGLEIFRSRNGELLLGSQESTSIWRIPVGSSTSSVLVHLGVGRNARQIEEDERYLYVTSANSNELLRVNRVTNEISVLLTATDGLIGPQGLVVTDTMIYYSNYSTAEIWAMRK